MAKGEIVNRAYDSPISTELQGYAVYIPKNYDPSRQYPMLIAMHGGSSNGNLFLGVVLGNNMDWKRYLHHLWDDFEPRWYPEWIVVAPTGFGQVMWRWMGEQDVLDVIDDVQRHYSVDPDRVVLSGLSNGGVGAYAIGARHASRFSAVMALAGAPSWVQYTGGRPSSIEKPLLERYSALHLAENTTNTDFRYFHGRLDGGPMKPRFVDAFTEKLTNLGITPNVTWYELGHDILYPVHRHGQRYSQWADIRRDRRPQKVTLVTGDYRANRQHWVTVERIDDYPHLARVVAKAQGNTLEARTDKVHALAFDLRDAPLRPTKGAVQIRIDNQLVYSGPHAHLGHVIHLYRDNGDWQLGFVPPLERPTKVPGLSGPITDAYRDRLVHVYGTLDQEATPTLKEAAEKGARGWPLWLWTVHQEVVADTAVTDALMQHAHVVLYGSTRSNRILADINTQLPVRASADGITVGSKQYKGGKLGAKFIYPNPRAPERYVIVQTGTTPRMVASGNRLPDFLPDYVVFDSDAVKSRPRLIAGSQKPLAAGFFDALWRLPAEREASGQAAHGDDVPANVADIGSTSLHMLSPSEARRLNAIIGAQPDFEIPQAVFNQKPHPQLPAPAPPPPLKRVRHFLAPAEDPAGAVARRIARRSLGYLNFRAIIPGGRWRVERAAIWDIRPHQDCLSELRRSGVAATSVESDAAPTTAVPSPIELKGAIGGVEYVHWQPDEKVVMACEFALRLQTLSAIAAKHGVHRITLTSAYRDRPKQSFHTHGLAADILTFETPTQSYSVLDDFKETPAQPTCEGPAPRTRKARVLRDIACSLWRSRRFASVLTPNYNEGHRNHIHIDCRPHDPRTFIR